MDDFEVIQSLLEHGPIFLDQILDKEKRWVPNQIIQGTASYIFKKSLLELSKTDKKLRFLIPMHDAILLESPIETLDRDVQQLENIMIEAGKIILDGFLIRVDTDITIYPDRYMDERGVVMWEKVQRLSGC